MPPISDVSFVHAERTSSPNPNQTRVFMSMEGATRGPVFPFVAVRLTHEFHTNGRGRAPRLTRFPTPVAGVPAPGLRASDAGPRLRRGRPLWSGRGRR